MLGVLGNEVRSDYRLAASKEKQRKRARIEIAKATELEERIIVTEPMIKQVETMHDLWQAFGWSQATKKKLPNDDLRKGDVLLKESGGSGWSTMVQSVLAAVARCAEKLYPANSDSKKLPPDFHKAQVQLLQRMNIELLKTQSRS